MRQAITRHIRIEKEERQQEDKGWQQICTPSGKTEKGLGNEYSYLTAPIAFDLICVGKKAEEKK